MKKSTRNNLVYWGVAAMIIAVCGVLALRGWRMASVIMLSAVWVWIGLCMLLNIHPMIEERNYSRWYCRAIALSYFLFAAGRAAIGFIPLGWPTVVPIVVVIVAVIAMMVVESREKREKQKRQNEPE